ncbi:MAG: hypothetical protein IPL21_14125 [Saprospirales bacterium]|nr:hypothetical protein [Saprospirales bacterium]
MNDIHQLKTLVDNYINNIGLGNILNLKINIPDFNGTFLIMTDKQLQYLEASEDDELCLLFSLKQQSKKNKSLLEKIKETNCLEDFMFFQFKDSIVFIKKTGNNSVLIIENVSMIVKTLFSTISADSIILELNEISSWHKLEENKKVNNTQNTLPHNLSHLTHSTPSGKP